MYIYAYFCGKFKLAEMKHLKFLLIFLGLAAQSPVYAQNQENNIVKFGPLSENLQAAVDTDTHMIGWLDMEGNTIIPFEYTLPSYYFENEKAGKLKSYADGAGEFHKGVTVIQKNGLWGVIDQNGDTVIPFIYSYQYEFIWKHFMDHGYFVLDRDGKSYMVDLLGEELYEAKNKDKIKSYFDKKGEELLRQRTDAGVYDDVLKRIADAGNAVQYKTERKMEESRREAELKRLQENSFRYFARNYVENKINEWQVKGEFEKTTDWQARVNEKTRTAKARELTKEAEKLFISSKAAKFNPHFSISGLYDADNETYLIESDIFGSLLVPVPLDEAPGFKENWNAVRTDPQYFLDGDTVGLAMVTFSFPSGNEYHYSNRASLEYAVAEIQYNFNPIEISFDSAEGIPDKGSQNITMQQITAGPLSDVDVAIPVSGKADKSTFAVIIANENYLNAEDVSFALNDGETFMTYCEKTLGIPEKNIRFYKNATFVTFKIALNWIEDVVRNYGPDAKVIFYYAGHGIPDEKSKGSMLLPVDGIPSDMSSCYSLDEVYGRLGGTEAGRVLVFMDSCFSGAERSGGMLASARGVAIKPKASYPKGNMIVMSAAQGDETAWQYAEKSHGMFTYFLLKKLKETKGEVSLGELYEYVRKNVSLESLVSNDKGQTPSVSASGDYTEGWEDTMLM